MGHWIWGSSIDLHLLLTYIVVVNKKFTFRLCFYSVESLRWLAKYDCETLRYWRWQSFWRQARSAFCEVACGRRAFRRQLTKLVGTLACSSRSVLLAAYMLSWQRGDRVRTLGWKKLIAIKCHGTKGQCWNDVYYLALSVRYLVVPSQDPLLLES